MTESEIAGKKKEIRSRVLALRDGLTAEDRKRASVLLTERILGHQWFYRSDVLLGFASYGSEIDTGEILQEALRLGKQVYLPRVVQADEGVMGFYRIGSMADLRPGYKGIPEPADSGREYCYSIGHAAHTLMMMPGAVFDGYRNRIGYGKGFYDRYLADKEELQLRTIGIGFRCQVVEEIPCGRQDIRPCQVICV